MKKRPYYNSDFLFVRPNFLIGMGSALNIAGNYFTFNFSDSDLLADRLAIESDWGLIGLDMESATESFSGHLNVNQFEMTNE